MRIGNGQLAADKRKDLKLASLALCAVVLFALCASGYAQQPSKVPRVGYISGTFDASNPGPYFEALRQGLRDLGHVEGKTYAIEYRGAEGRLDTIPALVGELVQSKVDVLVMPLAAAILAAKRATKTIPIVMITQVDPVAIGLVDSLAQPGGNITGLASLQRDLSGKRLELLAEVVPRLSRVGILYGTGSAPSSKVAAIALKEYESAARALKIRVQTLEVREPVPDLDRAFDAAVKRRAQAIITITSNPLFLNSKRIAELAVKNRLPSIYEGSTWVRDGGLMSYSANDLELFRRAATYVDRILKGARPAELPIEQPTKFEFVVNLATAKRIGVTIPQKVLVRADRVIR